MGPLRAQLASAAAFAALLAPAGAQFSDREYRYEPAVTVLSGLLAVESPEAVANDGGSIRETVYLLKLDQSIIVVGDATHEFNSRTEEVSEIQLARSSPRLELAPFVGRRVVATGRLFHKHSPYHHANVLMMVSRIEAE